MLSINSSASSTVLTCSTVSLFKAISKYLYVTSTFSSILLIISSSLVSCVLFISFNSYSGFWVIVIESIFLLVFAVNILSFTDSSNASLFCIYPTSSPDIFTS